MTRMWMVTAAVFVAILGVSESASVQCYNTDPATTRRKKIYTIQVGHDYGAYQYISPDGLLTGFFHDIIEAVCEEAGMDCRTTWDPNENCITSPPGGHLQGGPGLMGGWYDSCVGWAVTVERMAIYAFSASFVKGHTAAFYVRAEADDKAFDPDNFANKKIVFIDGWAGDEKCLARTTGIVLGADNVKHVKTVPEFVDAIINGEVDAGHAGDHYLDVYVKGIVPKLKKVGPSRNCVLSGNAMMARKDNFDFINRWNEGFSKLVSDGRYKKMCDKAKLKHTKGGGRIDCV